MAIDVSNTPDMFKITISGSFTFNTNCRVRNTPEMSDSGVATYTSGMTVEYDSKLKNGNHLWLSYMANSGTRRYIPYANTNTGIYFGSDTNSTDPIKAATNDSGANSTGSSTGSLGTLTGQAGANVADRTPDGTTYVVSGTFTFKEAARGRDNNLMAANKGDSFGIGDTVVYNAKVKNDGHYWLRYAHYGVGTYYVPYATINPFRNYGSSDTNPGDPVYPQNSTIGGDTGGSGSGSGSGSDRPHTGVDTGVPYLNSSNSRTDIKDGYIYPTIGSLTITSNAWGRDRPFMKTATQIKKYLKGTFINYNAKVINDGHLWVVLRNGQYLPVSTIDHVLTTMKNGSGNTSNYSYVTGDSGKVQPIEELWPYTKSSFHSNHDVSNFENSDDITDIASTVELSPSPSELTDLQKLADEVNATADSQSISIAYITDTHFDSYKTPASAHVLRSIQLMSYYSNHFGVDLMIHGGDLNDGTKPKNVSEADVKRCMDAMKMGRRPFIVLQGNHDDNSGYARDETANNANQIITNSEALALRRNYFAKWLKVPNNNPNNAVFGRYDIPNSNVTVLILDGFDMPDYSSPDRYMMRHGHTEYSTAQQSWLKNTLTSLNGSRKVVVFDHIALNGISPSAWAHNLGELFENFTYKHYLSGVASSRNIYNILTTHQSQFHNILGFFAGHTHADNHAYSGGIQFVTSTCGLADRGYDRESRSIHNISENAWEIIQINPTRNQIIQYRMPNGFTDDFFKKSWTM
ncbi:hypothetical protein DIS15_01855 [Levilactobacillus brevis]|uniref:SH3 domain-containing protein n=1 Tax=Levilactobacillus brevis TaxID=1580 RepID=UPI001122FC26|nr:SH3 domain-containing protein [Levilactobacillus brevis]TOY86218.1 hypothetical protein DIS15_01855 [Levilactobacillus brevis]